MYLLIASICYYKIHGLGSSFRAVCAKYGGRQERSLCPAALQGWDSCGCKKGLNPVADIDHRHVFVWLSCIVRELSGLDMFKQLIL